MNCHAKRMEYVQLALKLTRKNEPFAELMLLMGKVNGL